MIKKENINLLNSKKTRFENYTFSILHIYIFLFIAFISGCIEPIGTESTKIDTELVVEGWVRTDKEQQQVTLSYTKEIDVFRADETIDASVHILDNEGNAYALYNTEDNTYKTRIGEFVPVIGRSYTLSILIGNKRVLSKPEVLLPVAKVDSIYFEYTDEMRYDPAIGLVQRFDYISVYVDLQDPSNEKNYYLWQNRAVLEYWTVWPPPPPPYIPPPEWPTRCFICKEPINDDIFLEEDTYSDGKKIIKKKVGKIGLSRLEPLMFVATQLSLTRNAYEYLQQLQLQIDNSGSIFDAPPGLLLGNLYNSENADEKIYGYFKVSDVEEAKVYIPRYKYPNPGNDILEPKDCREEPGADSVMPAEYFEFLRSLGKW